MVYERVKWIEIPVNGGSIYGTGSHFDKYSSVSIDGKINKIQWDIPTVAQLPPVQAGSALITISGLGESVLTAKNVFNTSWSKYVRAPITDINNVTMTMGTGSDNVGYADIVCRDSIIRIVGSGFGLNAGSCGGTFKIFYS
jgi:hypothetical protein